MPAPERWSGRVSLTPRILAVNVFALALLAGGFFYLDSYRTRIVDDRLVQSARELKLLAIGLDTAPTDRQDRLIAAYDDAQGVTAAFNLNLIERINRELDGDMPIDGFAHRAVWNDEKARIEMHLEAVRPLNFQVAGARFHMERGETIHTESSHKYGTRDQRVLLRAGGWDPADEWTDAEGLFGLVLAQAA